MEQKISESELNSYLEILKDTLQNFDTSSISNVIFINFESFYSYLDNTCLLKGKTISEILSIIEPYIPLSLCVDDESLEIFIQASLSSSDEEIRKLEDKFYRKAKIEFIDTLRKAKTKEQWDYIVKICQSLRDCIYC